MIAGAGCRANYACVLNGTMRTVSCVRYRRAKWCRGLLSSWELSCPNSRWWYGQRRCCWRIRDRCRLRPASTSQVNWYRPILVRSVQWCTPIPLMVMPEPERRASCCVTGWQASVMDFWASFCFMVLAGTRRLVMGILAEVRVPGYSNLVWC